MHLRARAQENLCGMPHCPYCRNKPRRGRLTGRDVVGLVAFFGSGAGLLVILVLAAVFPR